MRQESYEAVRARVQASSYIDIEVPKSKRRTKQHRLIRKAAQLDRVLQETLLGLLEGDWSLLTIQGSSYAVHAERSGQWIVRRLTPFAEHRVTESLDACSCPRGRFDSTCKHILALRRLLCEES